MTSVSSETTALRTLLQKHHALPAQSLLADEMNLLIDSFLPSPDASIRGQSLIFLSKFSSDVRNKYSGKSNPDVPTVALVNTFSAPLEARLADTQEPATLSALLFLTALFQVDWASGCEIFARDGFFDSVMDTPDIYPSSQAIAVALARLLSQASGHKQCRALPSAAIAHSWLYKSLSQAKDPALRAAAAVAAVKLARGSEMDAQSSSQLGGMGTHPPPDSLNFGTDDHLAELMKQFVVTEDRLSPPVLDAVEGLAYLTVQAAVKESISTDSAFVECLMGLVPRRPSAPSFPASHTDRNVESRTPDLDIGLSYGIAVIISNICGYKPRLSDEEQQIERLRRMTKEPGAKGKLSADVARMADQDKLDDDKHVRVRGKRLLAAGAVEALTGIIRTLGIGQMGQRSRAAQRAVASALLSLVEEKANRGRILQGGGAKALLSIISVSMAALVLNAGDQGSIDKLDLADLVAVQALAKLSITSPPAAVFGSTRDSYVDVIRPLAILLIHSSASLLQRFEAVMALTNIASVTPEAAERVSSFRFIPGRSDVGDTFVGDIVKCVETHLLDSNIMLRRASTELICNLVGGAEGSFDYFGGAAGSSAKSRLQILVALADVDDRPTRLAASGALATLTASPDACQALAKLEMERHRVLPMLVELISPEIAREYREERPEDEDDGETSDSGSGGDPGLVHRGVVCVRNLFANLDAKEDRRKISLEADSRGLVRALVQTIKSNAGGAENGAIVKPAAEVLKWILQSGVKLPL